MPTREKKNVKKIRLCKAHSDAACLMLPCLCVMHYTALIFDETESISCLSDKYSKLKTIKHAEITKQDVSEIAIQ